MFGQKKWLKLSLFITLSIMLVSCERYVESNGPEVDKLLKSVQNNPTNEHKKVLHLWSFHQAKEFEFWQTLAQQYQLLNPDIEIKVEYISSDDYFTGNRLLASFASGQGPDIFFVSTGNIQRLAEVNMLYPLNKYFNQELMNDFDPAALDAVKLYNNIYAIPIETELLGLYYNKKMFLDHHVEPPKTWGEMMAAAKKLKSDQVSGLTVETFGSVYQNFTWFPFLWQTGADLIAENGKNNGLNMSQNQNMYAFYRNMIDQGLINMQPSRPTTDIGIIASGETAMQVSGTWNVRLIETEYADKSIGVVPLPIQEGGKPVTIAGGWKIAVNQHSEQAEEAAKFIMWAFAGSPDIPLRWCSEIKFAYSPRKSVMEVGKNYYRRGLREVFTNEIFGTERQEPRFPEEINRIFSQSLQNLLYSHATGTEIVKAESEKIDQYLSGIQK